MLKIRVLKGISKPETNRDIFGTWNCRMVAYHSDPEDSTNLGTLARTKLSLIILGLRKETNGANGNISLVMVVPAKTG